MDTKRIDLHVHSTASDGSYTPEELVAYAVKKQLSAFALTDHDTVAGILPAQNYAKQFDLELIPGIELSTNYLGTEIHILGLCINIEDTTLHNQIVQFQQDRKLRNEKMIWNLQQEGFSITLKQLEDSYPNSVITRAHMARYLYETKAISKINTAFQKYIGDQCKCYVPREKITSMEAIQLIRNAHGVPILAHPILYPLTREQRKELVVSLKDAGLAGIEGIYSTHVAADEREIRHLAKENNLLLSGGSDFHGSLKPYIDLGCGRGNLNISYDLLTKIKNYTSNEEKGETYEI